MTAQIPPYLQVPAQGMGPGIQSNGLAVDPRTQRVQDVAQGILEGVEMQAHQLPENAIEIKKSVPFEVQLGDQLFKTTFSLQYNGKNAPVRAKKLNILANQAKLILQHTYNKVLDRHNRGGDFYKFSCLTSFVAKNAFSEYENNFKQLKALQNMQHYNFIYSEEGNLSIEVFSDQGKTVIKIDPDQEIQETQVDGNVKSFDIRSFSKEAHAETLSIVQNNKAFRKTTDYDFLLRYIAMGGVVVSTKYSGNSNSPDYISASEMDRQTGQRRMEQQMANNDLRSHYDLNSLPIHPNYS